MTPYEREILDHSKQLRYFLANDDESDKDYQACKSLEKQGYMKGQAAPKWMGGGVTFVLTERGLKE